MTTQKQIANLIKDIATITGHATSKSQAIAEGKTEYLSYDYAPVWGGYQIIMIDATKGSHGSAFGISTVEPRQKAAQFYNFLRALKAGLEYNAE